jgi:hypothetical protein
MTRPRLVLCSGVDAAPDLASRRTVLRLDSVGNKSNVNLVFENVARVFLRDLAPRLVDLLEIAAYVYTADCAVDRGDDAWQKDAIEPWTRDFTFVIPVRDPSFWSSSEVRTSLTSVLGFLSDDVYDFRFVALESDRTAQQYLEFGPLEDWPVNNVERVLMFSGGLDSLAGAAETAAVGKNLILVSHRSVATIDSRQRALFHRLQELYPRAGMLHIPVWINKEGRFGREPTQRTRSFLYSALGAVVAESAGAPGVSFFENGIVSLNLPVADEVVRARASRTTHPLTLSAFEQFYQLVMGHPVAFENPYLFDTKAEVLTRIKDAGAAGLIPYTCSCSHSMFKPRQQWHCGTCSQCVDRRFAMLAAGMATSESETDYESDVFVGLRKEGYERNIAIDYVRHGLELAQLSANAIAERFNVEFARATKCSARRSHDAERLIELHRRHGRAVSRVLYQQLQLHAPRILDPGLPPSSLLALITGGQHLRPAWKRYCEEIIKILQVALPKVFKSQPPNNEARLQEVIDGMLTSFGAKQVREYPFMRWASVLTKPDWYIEALTVLIEAKFVRKGEKRRISEEIAADITKYGANRQNVLFLVYDPDRAITDDEEFISAIEERDGMMAAILR